MYYLVVTFRVNTIDWEYTLGWWAPQICAALPDELSITMHRHSILGFTSFFALSGLLLSPNPLQLFLPPTMGVSSNVDLIIRDQSRRSLRRVPYFDPKTVTPRAPTDDVPADALPKNQNSTINGDEEICIAALWTMEWWLLLWSSMSIRCLYGLHGISTPWKLQNECEHRVHPVQWTNGTWGGYQSFQQRGSVQVQCLW